MDDRDLIATALPGYEIGEELGRGSFGVVLAGRHRQLGRDVAIKRLSSSLGEDAEIRRRFVNEARLLGGLDHPHVVPVFDFVESDGLLLLVMERLRGGTVSGRLAAMSPEVACAVVLACCAGLHHAHGRGVLHRDIKPDNLMFTDDGTLKVTDFGIAKVVGGSATVMTKAGSVQGTPDYMAPEQVQSLRLSPATDVYAAGTVLYELLAGRLPYGPTLDIYSGLFRRVQEDPMPLAIAAPHIPPELAAVVDKSIARQPEDRYETAELLGEAVALAASAAWGPGWLDATAVPVFPSGRMAKALTHHTPVMPAARHDDTRKVATTARLPASADAVEDPAGTAVPKGPARARLRLLAVLAVVVVVGGIGAAVLLSGGGGGNASPPGTTGRPSPTTPVTASAASGVVPPPAGGPTAPGDVLGRKVVPVKTEQCKAPTTGNGAEWQLGPVQVKDRMFDTAYYCNLFAGGRGSLDFVLGGAYRQLAVTIGFADKLSSPSARATFEIVGDGKDYLTPPQTLTFGQVATLAVDVAGVTRLTITVTEVGTPGGNQAASVPVLAGPTLSPPS